MSLRWEKVCIFWYHLTINVTNQILSVCYRWKHVRVTTIRRITSTVDNRQSPVQESTHYISRMSWLLTPSVRKWVSQRLNYAHVSCVCIMTTGNLAWHSVTSCVFCDRVTYPFNQTLTTSSYIYLFMGRDSSVGIATRYGLDGPGIESRWGGEIFRTRPDRSWGPPSLLYNGYRVLPGGKAAGAWCWPPTPI